MTIRLCSHDSSLRRSAKGLRAFFWISLLSSTAGMSSQRQQTLAHFRVIHSELGGKILQYQCKHDSCKQTYSGGTSVSKALANHVAKHAEADAAAARIRKPAIAASVDAEPVESVIHIDNESVGAAAAAPVAAVSVQSSATSGSKRTLHSMFAGAGDGARVDKLAAAIACNSLAHRLVREPNFRAFLAAVNMVVPSKERIRDSILRQAAALRKELVQRLRHATMPISLASDGWTNVRHEKVTNIVLLCGGTAYYWCSIVNSDESNTAEWLYSRISPILQELINEHKVRISAFVADNESVNGATHRRLLADFPFLIHVPCAAHTVQLIVRNVLAAAPFVHTVRQFTSMLKTFELKKNSQALRALQAARGVKQLVLQRPNDTRWSSTLYAIDRALEVREELTCCFDVPSIPDKAAFFAALGELAEFLRPFQIATDAMQKDGATLYTVYLHFIQLLQHSRRRASAAATEAIMDRWQERINVNATVACCILSFTAPVAGLEQAAAQSFICSFGAQYIRFYSLAAGGVQELQDRITLQLAQFVSRQGAFVYIDSTVESLQRASSSFDPRLVWHLLAAQKVELAIVALALLSVAASEASVERTFSAQDAVHSKNRNRLGSSTIEAEVFMKFNLRHLSPAAATNTAVQSALPGCVELDGSYEADSDCETLVDPDTLFTPQPKRPRRQPHAAASDVESEPEEVKEQHGNDEWISKYLRERGKHAWTREDDNLLEAAALNRSDSTAPLPAVPEMRRRIKEILAHRE
jgi:hypothetical protein